MAIQLDSIKYKDLIDLGFKRQDMEDDVCFRENGYYGFCLNIEFPSINIGIGTGSKEQNISNNWEFQIYKIDTANVVRKVSFIELKSLIEFFSLKEEEVSATLSETESLINSNITE